MGTAKIRMLDKNICRSLLIELFNWLLQRHVFLCCSVETSLKDVVDLSVHQVGIAEFIRWLSSMKPRIYFKQRNYKQVLHSSDIVLAISHHTSRYTNLVVIKAFRSHLLCCLSSILNSKSAFLAISMRSDLKIRYQ